MPAYPEKKTFLEYLASLPQGQDDLPSLGQLSQQLGTSIAALREQLEVARALGLVEVRPRIGIRRLPYQFSAAVERSLEYAVALDRGYFYAFADLRKHVELSYWHEAVSQLTEEDKEELQRLLSSAWDKLEDDPIQIPHEEHRLLHLTIFRRLDNPFVIGILQGYWAAYQAIGLTQYADLSYLREVWSYHQIIVESILSGDYEAGHQALMEHTDLISHRKQ